MSRYRIPGTRTTVSVAVRQRLIFAGFTLLIGLLVGGVTFLMINFGNNKEAHAALGSNMGFENGTTEWTSVSGSWNASNTYTRTGANALKITQGITTDGEIKNTNCTLTAPATGTNKIVVTAYARSTTANGSLKLGVVNTSSGTKILASTYTALTTTGFTRVEAVLSVVNGATYAPVIIAKSTTLSSDIYVDDVHMYSTTASASDVTAPTAAKAVSVASSGTTVSLTWTNGTDAASGIDGVTILRYNGINASTQALNDQATYHATNANIGPTSVNSWTVLYQGSSITSFSDNPGAGVFTYLVFMRDKAFNYSTAATTARAVVLNGSSPTTASLSADLSLDGLYIASGNTLTVGASRTMTLNANAVANVSGTLIHQGTITANATASVNMNSGSLYQYDYDGGSLVSATWNTGSTCEITGLKHNTANNLAQTYYNFTWNSTQQLQSNTLPGGVVVNGDFKLMDNSPGSSNNRIVVFNGLLTVKGNFYIDASATYTCNPGSYILFNGSALQTIQVLGSACEFNAIEIDNAAGVKQLSNVTVDSLARLTNGALDLNTYAFKHQNNVTIVKGLGTMTGGTFTPVISSYTYNLTYERVNTTATELTSSTSYLNNLTINTPAGETVTLNKTANVNGTFTLTSGTVQTGSYEIYVRNTATSAVVQNASTSFVYGNLRRAVSGTGNPSYVFPVGRSAYAETLTLNMSNLAGVSNVLATFSATITGASPLCWVNGTRVNTLLNCGIWTLTPNAQPTSGTYTVVLNGKGYTNPASSATMYAVIKRDNSSSSWKSVGTHANNTQSVSGGVVTAQRSGLSSSFGDFGIAYGSYVLPITLSAFEAIRQGNGVTIAWTTSAEVNNAFFALERSVNGIDFEMIDEQEGQGTSTVPHDYVFSDEHPLSGTNYYRLKQVDFDGSFTYSPIRQVTISTTVPGDTGPTADIEVFPNPGNGLFNLANLTTSGTTAHATVSVYNVQGQLVLKQFINDASPKQIDLTDQPVGVYSLQITDANGVAVTKQIVVQR